MSKMKQVTIKVEAFVTVTVPDDISDGSILTNVIPSIDVETSSDYEDSPVDEVIETAITSKEIQSSVNI